VDQHPVVLFDGVCNLCNGSVVFIIRRDPRGVFRFAPLQSPAAAALLGERVGALPDSLVLIENGRVYTQSTAVLRVARRLRQPWPLVSALIVLPAPLRDWLYAWIARNRYRWFGRREVCMVPTPELQARFLT
jgi:predicted DCC family thiol-disulfide oxidoreductase YuxK